MAIGIALLAVTLRLLGAPQTVDDAYITYRYAANLERGHGFVYNPGERVLGTTTPGWTLFLALSARCGLPIEGWALTSSAIAGGLLAGVTVLLAAALGAPPALAGLAGLLWALNPLALRVDTSGMETAAFLLCSYLALLLATAGHPRGLRLAAGLSAGLAALIRPEGVLVVGLVLLANWVRSRDWRLEPAFALTLPALWIAFAWWYFGNPLPNSIAAKLATYAGPSPAEVALAFGRNAHFFLLQTDTDRIGAAVAGLAVLFSLLAALWRPSGRLIAAFPVLYVASFVAASPELFFWYHVPPGPGAVAAACALAGGAWQRLREKKSAILRALGTGGVIIFSGMSVVNSLTWMECTPERRWLVKIEESLRERRYIETAREIRRIGVAADTWVAAPEIGALGWVLLDAPILDTVGLVSPAAIPYSRWAGEGKISPALLAALKPTFVVMPASFAPPPTALSELRKLYREVARLPGAPRLGRWVTILQLIEGEGASPPVASP